MSDTMLLGVLRMPLPDDPDALTVAQLAGRAREAADRIGQDAEEIERLRMVLQAIKDWDIDEALRPDSERGALFALPLHLRALIQAALGANG